jgi:methylated-DNA-[protein]-cysteine S-methyltransferase
MNNQFFTQIESPVGVLTLTATSTGLTGLLYDGDRRAIAALGGVRDPAPFADVVSQLGDYFAGRRTSFELDLAPAGTPFQKRVWMALREIRFGRTLSYGEIARDIGAPTASRAVGAANGQNPISIIVPCHRVIGKSGSLTGYGGGIPRKKFLLDLEMGKMGLFARNSLPTAQHPTP